MKNGMDREQKIIMNNISNSTVSFLVRRMRTSIFVGTEKKTAAKALSLVKEY